ncbi:protein S100-A10b [Betta splendens]|uniref:Protein S100-A10b n=1 Tax=Betta splendens TaxID=158456 RepID=A0A6P7KRZ9_BETSP|nr:protein S100-A10b [Betta splendens]
MTELETCMKSLIDIFHRYADSDSDGTSLTKKELKKLCDKELPSFMKAQKNPEIVDRILKDLDNNKDEKLNFEEFLPFICSLMVAADEFCLSRGKKGKK